MHCLFHDLNKVDNKEAVVYCHVSELHSNHINFSFSKSTAHVGIAFEILDPFFFFFEVAGNRRQKFVSSVVKQTQFLFICMCKHEACPLFCFFKKKQAKACTINEDNYILFIYFNPSSETWKLMNVGEDHFGKRRDVSPAPESKTFPFKRRMYNTSRGGGEGGEGSSGVNVKKWLADNKLSEVEKVFLEREIQIEELADFQAEELADFAKDLGKKKSVFFATSKKKKKNWVKQYIIYIYISIQDMRKARPPAYGESSGMSTTGMLTSTLSTTTSSTLTTSSLSSTSGYGGEPSSGLTTTTGMSVFGSSSSSSSSNVHVMVSPQEHKAMNKLQQYFDKSGLVVQQLTSSPAALKKSATECESEINEKLERIVASIEDKRKQLLRQVDGLKQEKEMKLKEQLTTLLQYQQVIGQGKNEYEAIMANSQLDVVNRKKEVVRVAQAILTRKGVNLIVATQPKMQFTFETAVLDKFLKDLDIDDCDQPFPPIVAVVKATFNTIT
ncbi:putative serine-rich protein, partial [Reticulomyxa filosa]